MEEQEDKEMGEEERGEVDPLGGSFDLNRERERA